MTRARVAAGALRAAAAGVAVSAAVLAGCSEAPVTGRNQLILMSEGEASQMGVEAYRQILQEKGVARDTGLQQRVQTIGSRIAKVVDAPGTRWEFTVIDDDTPNAFALPGGKVGVHRGLFRVAQTDAQLAAVIAHEIAHVTARHPAERMSRQALTQTGAGLIGSAAGSQALSQVLAQAATLGLQLPFSRSQEAEADTIGLRYMAQAGYDPRAAVEVWRRFAQLGGSRQPEFLSTHPSPGNRVESLQRQVAEVMPIYRQNAR